jgi:rod shape-determining protein MreC
MRVQLLNGKADVKNGDRLVTFGSQADKPFVPGVPVGKVIKVTPSSGDLTKTIEVQPFVGYTQLDIVGVIVQAPRKDPRDSVLPAKPTPAPTVTVTATPSSTPSASSSATGVN